jgi:hypothetical protein
MKLLAIALALHALAAAATKKWEIANTTRATLPCAKTYHDKPTPFMYQESVLFLNFSQVGLPPVNESNKGYSVDRWWGRHHILRESIVGNFLFLFYVRKVILLTIRTELGRFPTAASRVGILCCTSAWPHVSRTSSALPWLWSTVRDSKT